MKAKITDYFTKNCADAARMGLLWYCVNDDRTKIMFTMDKIVLFDVDYELCLHAILADVHGETRRYDAVHDVMFCTEGKDIVTEDRTFKDLKYSEKYPYKEHNYLKFDDYIFDYDYFRRKLPKGDNIMFDVITPHKHHPMALMLVYENNIACMAICNTAYKKVGLYHG